MQPTVQLTAEQIQFYNDNGYLVIDQISTPEELAGLREIYDRLFAEKAGREKGNQFDLAGDDEEGAVAKLPQILGPSNFAPEMKETLAWANAGAIARALLGTEDIGQGDHAILKPAGYGAPTPWHQDEAYWDPGYNHFGLSIWMPLQDVDASSGCMHFVPGSHLAEVVEHQPIGNNPKVHGLETVEAIDMDRAVAVPLAAGGCTIHGGRTLHYAPGNTSPIDRRAWIMMANSPGTKRETPNDYHWQARWDTARQKRAEG